jgi:hypothetical protein
MTSDELALLADLVADAVADGQRGRIQPGRLLTAAEAAAYLAVEPGYVYQHAIELGGRKLPGGPRGRLRFSLEDLEKAMTPGGSSGGSRGSEQIAESVPERIAGGVAARGRRRDRARRAETPGIPLLPIKRERPL